MTNNKVITVYLDYFGARYYDSDISVWLSVDPLANAYSSTSPYMYVRGNPIMLVDPNGMYDDKTKAQKAQEKAVKRYGDANVGNVYFDRDKEEYGFRISRSGFKQHKGKEIKKNADASADGSTGVFGDLRYKCYSFFNPTKEELDAPAINVEANFKIGLGSSEKIKFFGFGSQATATGSMNVVNWKWNSKDNNLKTTLFESTNLQFEIGDGPFHVGANYSIFDNKASANGQLAFWDVSSNKPLSFNVIDLGIMSNGAGFDLKVSAKPYKVIKAYIKVYSDYDNAGILIHSFSH